MSSSRALKLSFLGVLLLSVAWKLAIPSDNSDDLKISVIEFLERNHFRVTVTEQMVNYMPIIRAEANACHLEIARLAPDGSNWNLIQNSTEHGDRLLVVFRGRVYARPPVLKTVLYYLGSRFLRELGLIRHITPVIAVAANPSCRAEEIPWSQIAALQNL